jgi:hypothetical protein
MQLDYLKCKFLQINLYITIKGMFHKYANPIMQLFLHFKSFSSVNSIIRLIFINSQEIAFVSLITPTLLAINSEYSKRNVFIQLDKSVLYFPMHLQITHSKIKLPATRSQPFLLKDPTSKKLWYYSKNSTSYFNCFFLIIAI